MVAERGGLIFLGVISGTEERSRTSFWFGVCLLLNVPESFHSCHLDVWICTEQNTGRDGAWEAGPWSDVCQYQRGFLETPQLVAMARLLPTVRKQKCTQGRPA